jgi:hypothetical protein
MHSPAGTEFPEYEENRVILSCIFYLTCPDTRGQYLWMRPSMVRGMVNRQRNMLDRAKLAMKMFRAVLSIWKMKMSKF